MRNWNSLADNRSARLKRAASLVGGKLVPAELATALLAAVLEPGATTRSRPTFWRAA